MDDQGVLRYKFVQADILDQLVTDVRERTRLGRALVPALVLGTRRSRGMWWAKLSTKRRSTPNTPITWRVSLTDFGC